MSGVRRWFRSVSLYWRGRHQRCDHCHRRKHWNGAWHSYPSTDRVWHDVCMSYRHWRSKADERLAILDLVTDVWAITADDVRTMAEGRASTGANHRTSAEANAWNRAWRVFYDLDHYRTPTLNREVPDDPR